MSNFDTHKKELKTELLDSIHTRETALPDFQRDFVWQPGQTKWLILSLSKSFPAGSLLRIESGHEMFQARAFAGAPDLNGHKPKYLILDGQQRLTSLYQALYGTGEHLYYVDMRKLEAERDLEDALIYERRPIGDRRYGTIALQAEKRVLPLSQMFGGDGFHSWLDSLEDYYESQENSSALSNQERKTLRKLYEEFVEPIVKYEFPVVTLPANTALEAVCTIFETLNSSGVRLSVFDLLAARFFAKGQNLRQMWADAVSESKYLEAFEIDPYYLLQAVSALLHKSVKRSDVLKLSPDEVVNAWDEVVRGMNQALDLLYNGCGVLKPSLLSYTTILVPLGAAFAQNLHLTGPSWGAFRNKMKRWYWCSVFSQAYESNPTSQSITDLNEIAQWVEGGPEPTSVREFVFERERLLTTTSRQRAIYRGVLCLLLRDGPIDFHSAKTLSAGVMEENHVDDHHIFPNAYLTATTQLPQNEIDAIVNRTLIDRETNQRIGKNPPGKYLAEIQAGWDNDILLEDVLRSHYLPVGADSSLRRDDFEAFRNERAVALYNLIMKATS